MYILYRIYVLQNNDSISMDEEETMGGGLGGFPPLHGLLMSVTSVDSTDILCVSRILYSTLQSYIMSLLRKYCTVHYLFCKFCTVHYSGAVHKYCAILTSVDSTDILCSTDISRQ